MHKLNQVCKEKVKIALKTSKIKAASTYSYESKKNHFYTVTNQLCKMLNLFIFFFRVEIIYIRKKATSLVIDLLVKSKRAARVLFCF